MTGLFITLEGPEGAGKSTQIQRLKAWLEDRGYTVVVTRNPGGTPIGSQIRRVLLDPENTAMTPLAELMLYAADRAQHVAEVVRPALEAGHVVLCDRYTDSTLAYQGYGRGLDLLLLRSLNAMATEDLRPDLTLLLDLAPEVGLARIAATRASDRLEHEALAFHQRLREGYLELAAESPERFWVVSADQPEIDVELALRAGVEALVARARC